MTEPDQKTTLREFKEYVALSYESPREIAARVGVAQKTIWDWLAGKSQPQAQSLAKLRRFLDEEAKRPAQGDGIRPIETEPYKIIRPLQQVRYARICPFCRKARGKIRKLGADSFLGHAPSVERAGRSGKATRKPYELGTVENEYQGQMTKQLNSVALCPITLIKEWLNASRCPQAICKRLSRRSKTDYIDFCTTG